MKILLFKNGKEEFKTIQNVRIKNINAEEIRNKDEKKKAIAIKQKEDLKNKLMNAEVVNLLDCGEREKYGRLLCELEIVK